MLSILIPTYNYDITHLVYELHKQATKAEIDLPTGTDVHSVEVYEKSVENFKKFQSKGWLVQDEVEKFYIYAQKQILPQLLLIK